MEKKLILTAETGSDLTAELAAQYGIYLVPMHVTMGDTCLDDGAFPADDVCAYYDRTGKVPATSACNPEDFVRVFDQIHAAHPNAQILHLAYSAATTCSYQNAGIASVNRDYVTRLDTKQVSLAQAMVAVRLALRLQENPDMTVGQAVDYAAKIAAATHMCFVPRNLDYLRAGGRVSNVVALTGNLLGLHPCIETINGELVASKKYRGSFLKVIPKLISEFSDKHSLSREFVSFIRTPGLSQELQDLAEESARKLGFQNISWLNSGCVITCHGGAGAIGMVGQTAGAV